MHAQCEAVVSNLEYQNTQGYFLGPLGELEKEFNNVVECLAGLAKADRKAASWL